MPAGIGGFILFHFLRKQNFFALAENFHNGRETIISYCAAIFH